IGLGTTAQDGSAFDADFCAARTACAAAAVRVSGLGSRCPKPVQTAMCRFARFPLGRELQNFNNNMTYSGYRPDGGMKVEDRSGEKCIKCAQHYWLRLHVGPWPVNLAIVYSWSVSQA